MKREDKKKYVRDLRYLRFMRAHVPGLRMWPDQ